MSNKKFKDLEEAQAAYDGLVSQQKVKQDEAVEKAISKLQKEHTVALDKAVADSRKEMDAEVVTLNNTIKGKDEEILRLTKRAEDAEEVANSAMEIANEPGKEPTVTIDKKKYRVVFGVDGKSKEEIRADKELLKKLIDKGSAAIEEVH